MKIRPKLDLFLWIFICIFLIVWLGADLWQGISKGEIKDLRTGDSLFLDSRPVWFSFVFIFKSVAIAVCFYFLYGVSQIASVKFKKAKRKKDRIKNKKRKKGRIGASKNKKSPPRKQG